MQGLAKVMDIGAEEARMPAPNTPGRHRHPRHKVDRRRGCGHPWSGQLGYETDQGGESREEGEHPVTDGSVDFQIDRKISVFRYGQAISCVPFAHKFRQGSVVHHREKSECNDPEKGADVVDDEGLSKQSEPGITVAHRAIPTGRDGGPPGTGDTPFSGSCQSSQNGRFDRPIFVFGGQCG